MRVVRTIAVIDFEQCTGCTICERVCPTAAITMENRLAIVDGPLCAGCNVCEQRCPEYCIRMVPRAEPLTLATDLAQVDRTQVNELCRRARMHPEQLVCFCTGTRADEMAAAVLLGARTPEELSHRTGVRTGCTVICHQPVLRILEAAGIRPEPPRRGWQWYGRTPTAWELSEKVKEKYAGRGFYFDADLQLMDRAKDAPGEGD
jgi:Pyruvate/2-oxoacid:ferredoxin oxidoreductase delta subunit/bacterioferritin-associated ferredoxin